MKAKSKPRSCDWRPIEPLESRVMLSGSPAAPTGLVANNGSTPSDIVLNWTASSGATSYQIWRNTSATTTGASDIQSNWTSTSYDDTQVTTGVTYYYWVVASNASGSSSYSTIASGTGGTLVFGDTFGVNGISTAWGTENATDPNNGSVHYTNTLPSQSSASNPTTLAVVSDSQATDGQALAMSLTPAPGQSGVYDSAEISTRMDPSGLGNSLEYGEIQARIKLPGGNNSAAIWPAFWMLGTDISSVQWPNCGEIDIMENDGAKPGTNDSTLHGPAYGGGDYNGGGGVGSSYTLPGNQDFYSAYHTFTLQWGPNSVTFSVDGTTYATLTPSSVSSVGNWVFNGHPFYIILDVCEGNPFAPGSITSTQTMDVDYVRAYSLSAPTNPQASVAVSGQQAKLTWAAVNGATSYEIWRNTTNNNSTAAELTTSTVGTSYTDTTAASNTQYYYWVVARNSYQISNFSTAAFSQYASSVSLASPPSSVHYDGKTDVDSWAVATVSGYSGGPAPTGSATLTWYSGPVASGTPLSSPPIALGTYTVVANYPGDTNYMSSQSAPQTFTIVNPVGLSTSAGAQYAINWSAGTPTLDVTAGTVTLSADLSTTFSNYALAIENGAMVVLTANQNVTQLHVAATGLLDIQSNIVYLNYGNSADPIGSVAAWIESAYDNGAWDGNGITSSSAATNAAFGIGYADSADTGNPAALQPNQIKIMYTLLGDANLDGKVNGTDFAILSSNFNQAVTSWDQGDFNYDGKVNGTDFADLSSNFNQGITPAVAASTPALTSTATQNGNASSSTPVATDLVKSSKHSSRPHQKR